MSGQRIQQEAICYQWFKQRLILSISEPSISQRSQIKEDTIEPSVPARKFNLKAYAAITRHNNPASLVLEPRFADHRSQAARTAMLPTASPRQAAYVGISTTISRAIPATGAAVLLVLIDVPASNMQIKDHAKF